MTDDTTTDAATTDASSTSSAQELTPQEKVAQGVELTSADVAALEAPPAPTEPAPEAVAAVVPATGDSNEGATVPQGPAGDVEDGPLKSPDVETAIEEATKGAIAHLEDAAHSLFAAADAIRGKFTGGGAL